MKISGLFKAVIVGLTLVVLSVASIGCGGGSNSSVDSQIRLINAIPDGPALDIYVNGTKIITNLAFGTVQPDPPAYQAVTPGNAVIQGFATGTNTNPVPPNATIPLRSATDYTVVAVGLELNNSPPLLLIDDNTAPAGGNVEFRIINASPSSPPLGVDVYIVPANVQDVTNFTPQIRGLSNEQASTYEEVPFLSGGYAVIVTAAGGKTPLISQPISSPVGSIRTVVILDNVGGNNGMSSTPLVMNDLN